MGTRLCKAAAKALMLQLCMYCVIQHTGRDGALLTTGGSLPPKSPEVLKNAIHQARAVPLSVRGPSMSNCSRAMNVPQIGV